MIFKLTAIISHKSFGDPVIKEIYFTGLTFDDVLDKIRANEVPENHLHNLRHHRRTAFKDAKGVKHSWQLEEMKN